MECPKCNKTIKDNNIECPFCGIVVAKYRPDEPFSPGTGISEPETRKPHVKIPYFTIGLVVAAAIIVWVIFKPEYAPEMTVVSFQNNETETLSCNAEEKCVVVYLAPW